MAQIPEDLLVIIFNMMQNKDKLLLFKNTSFSLEKHNISIIISYDEMKNIPKEYINKRLSIGCAMATSRPTKNGSDMVMYKINDKKIDLAHCNSIKSDVLKYVQNVEEVDM